MDEPAPMWTKTNLADPHQQADKAGRVRAMFSAIAPSYDLNNRLHSFGRDQAWRKAAVRYAQLQPGDRVLDVACGTGDLSLAFLRALGPSGQVVGLDYTAEMLDVARRKRPADDRLSWTQGDAMALPFDDDAFDVVSIAFGIRNVAKPDDALAEFRRVLRPAGRLVVLEFSEPGNPLVRRVDRFYRGQVMPRTATWIARDKSGAYAYLPRSVETFLSRQEMVGAIEQAGFSGVAIKPMTFGVAVLYRGEVVS